VIDPKTHPLYRRGFKEQFTKWLMKQRPSGERWWDDNTERSIGKARVSFFSINDDVCVYFWTNSGHAIRWFAVKVWYPLTLACESDVIVSRIKCFVFDGEYARGEFLDIVSGVDSRKKSTVCEKIADGKEGLGIVTQLNLKDVCCVVAASLFGKNKKHKCEECGRVVYPPRHCSRKCEDFSRELHPTRTFIAATFERSISDAI